MTALAPVVVEGGPFAGSYQTLFSNSASFPEDALVDYLGGPAIEGSARFLYVRDEAQIPAFYIYEILASPNSWNGVEDLFLDGFWPQAGAISQLQILGAPFTDVPESSTTALIAIALGALLWSRKNQSVIKGRPSL